ncbi:MAG: mechanosensitive ion channel family protein [bacterium]|nr:mechanosensitive ion channel family protein [bacterium]
MLSTPTFVYLQTTLSDACGSDPGFLCEFVWDQTGSEGLAEATEFMVRPVKVILIFLAAWIVNRIVRRLINGTIKEITDAQDAKATRVHEPIDEDPRWRVGAFREIAAKRARLASEQAERGTQRAETLGSVLRSIAALIIYTIATFMALAEFDVNLGPLIASAGIIGIAFGFGAQSLVKDFLSGIFMLIEDQYGVGDIIDVGEAAGVVEEVKLRTTKIRDVNGTLWHVPNGEIHRVANKSQDWARDVLDIEVAYDTDLTHAMTVIKGVADEVWHEALANATILEEPEIWGVESFGSDAIAIRLVVKVEPAEQWATARELRRRLKYAFDEEGIEIPFPQRTVWINNVPSSEPTTPPPDLPEVDFTPVVAAEGEVGA